VDARGGVTRRDRRAISPPGSTVAEGNERAGLITRGRTAQSRPSSLRVDALKEATMWMNARRELWEGRMDRLDRHLQQIQKGLAHE
jgi:hypothetical protein